MLEQKNLHWNYKRTLQKRCGNIHLDMEAATQAEKAEISPNVVNFHFREKTSNDNRVIIGRFISTCSWWRKASPFEGRKNN